MAVIDVLEENKDSKLFLTLLRVGVIPISILDRKVYYEFYLEQLKVNGKMQSIQNTCEEFNISQKTVYNAINLMES